MTKNFKKAVECIRHAERVCSSSTDLKPVDRWSDRQRVSSKHIYEKVLAYSGVPAAEKQGLSLLAKKANKYRIKYTVGKKGNHNGEKAILSTRRLPNGNQMVIMGRDVFDKAVEAASQVLRDALPNKKSV